MSWIHVLLLALIAIRQPTAPQPNIIQSAASPETEPVVQAILFYSPTCPHCHQVIEELLIPMQEEYGDKLMVIGIDTTNPVGSELYGRAVERFSVPETSLGVPTLVVGDVVLVGSIEIPEQFPALVDEGLRAGGIGWPDIPDLYELIPNLPAPAAPASMNESAEIPADEASVLNNPVNPTATSAVLPTENPTSASESELDIVEEGSTGGEVVDEAPDETVPETYQASDSLQEVEAAINPEEAVSPHPDYLGFTIAAIVLAGMSAALVYSAWSLARRGQLGFSLPLKADALPWIVPLLALLGLVVAIYLSYVEVAQVKAVCGPIGECNLVQSSAYAQLLGIPIAVLGVLSYVSVLILWAGQRQLPPNKNGISFTLLVALAIFSTIFSIYLTVLELFVIRAVCAWCLSSAIISTLIMIIAVNALVERQPSLRWKTQT
jgi:uncharacterized membrane protein/thiol-disulfide isomerase/thioredoxin